MSLKNEFKKMVDRLSAQCPIPKVSWLFFPPFSKGGQQKNAQFMAMGLEGGAAGISYVLLPEQKEDAYQALSQDRFIGNHPVDLAHRFGGTDPVKEMVGLAAINAICQHVMKIRKIRMEPAGDSLGLMAISKGDRIGMVGLFYGLVKTIKDAGAELIVIEKNEQLKNRYPDLPITLDPGGLATCNKILCTSTTILNNSLDNILSHCSSDALVTVVGPTAGFFPDPLFARGVDIVGGRVVNESDRFKKLMSAGKRWGSATQRTCFERKTYTTAI